MGASPQTLSLDDRRIVAGWAADCAEHVLAIYEDAVPADTVARSEAHRQVAAMSLPVARALSSLPALGESRAGPLSPGPLSGGQVGDAIRAIQAQLRDRA